MGAHGFQCLERKHVSLNQIINNTLELRQYNRAACSKSARSHNSTHVTLSAPLAPLRTATFFMLKLQILSKNKKNVPVSRQRKKGACQAVRASAAAERSRQTTTRGSKELGPNLCARPLRLDFQRPPRVFFLLQTVPQRVRPTHAPLHAAAPNSLLRIQRHIGAVRHPVGNFPLKRKHVTEDKCNTSAGE